MSRAPGGDDRNQVENLSLSHPNSSWFDDTGTAGTVETRDDIVKQAIVHGLSYLASLDAFTGLAPPEWHWGKVHQVYFAHLAGLSPFGRGPYPADGSSNTVNPTYGGVNAISRGGA